MFVTLLTVLFIGLKLAGIITWSWLWVLSPLWIGALIAIAIVAPALFMNKA